MSEQGSSDFCSGPVHFRSNLSILAVVLAVTTSGGRCAPSTGTAIAPSTTILASTSTCGSDVIENPSSRPIDACRDGALVFGPRRVVRATGQPTDETWGFSTPNDGAACVLVVNGDEEGEHRISSLRLWIDDGAIIGPSSFNQNVPMVEQTTYLEAGDHALRVRLPSNPAGYVDVSVTAGDSSPRSGEVASEQLELFNLYADPTTLTAPDGSTQLSGLGTVIDSRGCEQGCTVLWSFEIVRASDCVSIRWLSGSQLLALP
ncbi:MAG: hypothetical protein ABIJ09_17870, partial [Pseudomonadota bacterium]